MGKFGPRVVNNPLYRAIKARERQLAAAAQDQEGDQQDQGDQEDQDSDELDHDEEAIPPAQVDQQPQKVKLSIHNPLTPAVKLDLQLKDDEIRQVREWVKNKCKPSRHDLLGCS